MSARFADDPTAAVAIGLARGALDAHDERQAGPEVNRVAYALARLLNVIDEHDAYAAEEDQP